MKIRWIGLGMAVVLLAMGANVASAQGDELSELRARFKERFPALLKAKTAQKIGEAHTGYVAAVKEAHLTDAKEGPALKKLIESENADRKALYKILASREPNITEQRVAERNALRNFVNAAANEMIMPKGKGWMLRKEYEPPKS